MDKKNNDAKFTIEGNPGQNNTFINIGTAYNVNPNATKVENTFNIGSREESNAVVTEAMGGNHDGKKLGAMTLREMLKKDMIDTGNIKNEILNYISSIRIKLESNKDKLYLQLWGRIIENENFKMDLYDPGKQQCTFNRNLVANIIHYLDTKGFYMESYNQSAMARALEGDDQHPVRGALGKDPEPKYCKVIDEILNELEEK